MALERLARIPASKAEQVEKEARIPIPRMLNNGRVRDGSREGEEVNGRRNQRTIKARTKRIRFGDTRNFTGAFERRYPRGDKRDSISFDVYTRSAVR
ncbi:MAG: hypothetical protein UX57_C0004G0104 [Candidatus Uhrbacteria bacterium GW2011_GWE2_46_68]|uniref:Uncharacterized protein n=2 Tax=Candidatus Uhriibacteriota TaxID=1752732 RepID=A0A0G1T7J5_9BACT|nr:MAG: hypothetical protein UX45_C0001G0036 [Candidatus Uhrbacteria bacterium GW2011_GWF2_46_218]KKU41400.1 MAG: hypothetical protein UX57_C0004G0104 [Candidatus Uhrbacteria bacterium GW2011_GWE2_46_68]